MAIGELTLARQNENPAPVAANLLTFPELKRAIELGIVPGNEETAELFREHFGNNMGNVAERILTYCKDSKKHDFRSMPYGVGDRLRVLRLEIVRDGPDEGMLRITLWGTPFSRPEPAEQ